MSRADLSRDRRHPFFLYVDEFQAVADDNFSQLLSESRKYGLGLILAFQYAGQLRNGQGPDVLDAVLGNVGTTICYRVGTEDARLLAPIFAPSVTEQDLLECPNWQGYVRLHLSRFPTHPFSFCNTPDQTPPDFARAKQLAEISRLNWGVPAETIDEAIRTRGKFIAGLPQTARQQRAAELGSPLEKASDQALSPPQQDPRETCAPMTQAHNEEARKQQDKIIQGLNELTNQLWKRSNWVRVYERCVAKVKDQREEALEEPFYLFLNVNIDWFIVLAQVLIEQRYLTRDQVQAFLCAKSKDERVYPSIQDRLNIVRDLCFT